MVVVDNISCLFRAIPQSRLDDKMNYIRYTGMLLRRLARRAAMPVLINNHFTTAYNVKDRPASGITHVPYLGDTWTFLLDFRLTLEYHWQGSQLRRTVRVSKSTYSLPPKVVSSVVEFSTSVGFRTCPEAL